MDREQGRYYRSTAHRRQQHQNVKTDDWWNTECSPTFWRPTLVIQKKKTTIQTKARNLFNVNILTPFSKQRWAMHCLSLLGEWVFLLLLFFFFKRGFWSKSVTASDPAQQLKYRQHKHHFSVQMVNYTRPHMPIASQGALQWKSSTQSLQQKLHWSFLFCLTGSGAATQRLCFNSPAF